VLTAEQIRLYARQVILRELGQSGQARLCASRVVLDASAAAAQPRAAAVARDYLQRAGLQVVESEPGVPLALGEATHVEPALQACADWLLGAWAAVETIKQVAGVGTPAEQGPALWSAEVD
jgi:hypothetical protein